MVTVDTAAKLPAKAGGKFHLREYLTKQNVSMGFFLLCCLLIGSFERYTAYFSMVLLAVILYNWNSEDFYLYSVIFLFFWEQFYLIGGSTPLYRAYSYLVLFKFILEIGKARFRPQFLPALCVFVLFCVFSAGRMSLRVGLNLLADCLLCYMILIRVREKPKLLRRMFGVFILAAVCAGVYSLTAKTVVIYETGIGAQVEIVRYFGTVGDANYAGFFYNAAIFMVLGTDAFKRWYLRLPLMVLLLYFLVLTSSLTGMLCCVIGLSIYLVLRYRVVGIPLVILLALGAGAAYLALLYVPAVRDFPPFTTLSHRLAQATQDMESGNVRNLTTDRSQLWTIAWEYFTKQSLLGKLIGGSVITTVLSEEYFLKAVGAVHQSYVQGLLDFGIIGVTIVFGTRIFQTISDVCCCLRGSNMPLPEDLMRAVILGAFTFLFYALTIDMFMDWRFVFFFFI